MTSVGRYIPIYDAWSNEGGGRANEEATRYGEQETLEKIRPQYRAAIEGHERSNQSYIDELKGAQDAFVKRYGTDALKSKDELLRRGADDVVSLSAEGTAMLADLAKLEQKRVWTEKVVLWNDRFREAYRSMLEGMEASVASRQNAYDARFERDDEKRADAYERAQAAGKRLEELGARGAEWNARSVKRAADLAASQESSAALFASTKLFEFGRNGAVRIDANALARMGTTEAATSELARLIGALAERNGLGQLRDALIGTINGQNRRIAELTGAL